MTRELRANAGIVTSAGLRRLGFSEREVRGFVAHGDLRRLHHGVYADGRAALPDRAYLKAALLAVGGRSWLSGPAAAMGWGLEPLSLPKLEVTVVASSTPKPRGLRVRRTSCQPHPSEIRRLRDLRLSSIPRMLAESAAAGAEMQDLHRLIEQAVRRDLLDVQDLAATLERSRGRRGIATVRAACLVYLPHSGRKSGLERAFDRWLLQHRDIPAPERNVRLGPWEIDCYWPDHKLVVELDGRPYHTLVEEIERDRLKDTWLQARGLRIMRVTDSRFKRDRPGVRCDLEALLGLAGNGHG